MPLSKQHSLATLNKSINCQILRPPHNLKVSKVIKVNILRYGVNYQFFLSSGEGGVCSLTFDVVGLSLLPEDFSLLAGSLLVVYLLPVYLLAVALLTEDCFSVGAFSWPVRGFLL